MASNCHGHDHHQTHDQNGTSGGDDGTDVTEQNPMIVESITGDDLDLPLVPPPSGPPSGVLKRVFDEIRSDGDIMALRRRRSCDTDHLTMAQHGDTSDNNDKNHHHPHRQTSHMNFHHLFQDEILKACRLLQGDHDGAKNEGETEEKQALLTIHDVTNGSSDAEPSKMRLSPSNIQVLMSENATEAASTCFNVDEAAHHHFHQRTGHNFVIYGTNEHDHNSIHRAVSPPHPPSIASHHVMFDDYVVSPIPPPSNTCINEPCWILSIAYFWLFSPSRIAYFARIAGITAAVLSAFFSSLNYAISEYLEEGSFDPVEIFAWRQTLMIAFCFPVTAYYQKPMYFKRTELRLWFPMFIRSVGSAFAVLFVYLAIEFIPLSDATVVSNAAPIFCSFIARIFLKEPFGLAEILCAIAVLCGVTLNAQPAWLFDFSLFTSDLQKRLIGLAFALGGALATASTTVIMRTMKSVHFSTQQLMFGYISTALTWPFVFLMGVARLPPCSYDQKFIILASGFTAVPAQALLIYACQNEKAGIVSLARSTMPVFSLIFQITLFGIFPDIYSIIGNLIILGAIMALGIRMLLESRNKESASAKIGDNKSSKPSHDEQFYVELLSKVEQLSPNCTIKSTAGLASSFVHPNVGDNIVVSSNVRNVGDDEKSA